MVFFYDRPQDIINKILIISLQGTVSMSSSAVISPLNCNKTAEICEAILALQTLPKAQAVRAELVFTCRKVLSTAPSWSLKQSQSEPSAPIKPELCISSSCLWTLGTLLELQRDSLLWKRINFVNTNTSRRMELFPAQLSVLSHQGRWVQLRDGKLIRKTERTQLLCCILIAIFGKTHVILGLESWITAQLQWEMEETITMLQYGNILWDIFIHISFSTAKPCFHQIQKSEVFNGILGTSLSNSEVSSPRPHLYVYLEISRALKDEMHFSSWNMKLSSELLPRRMEQKDGAQRVAFWWTMAYEKPQSHDKRLLWGLRLSLTPPATSRNLGKTINPLDFIPTYCSSKHLDPLTTSKGSLKESLTGMNHPNPSSISSPGSTADSANPEQSWARLEQTQPQPRDLPSTAITA